MAAHTVDIDVIDKSALPEDHSNIPIINQPNPCYGYSATAKEVNYLMHFAQYCIYESGTNNIINGNTYLDYFPEEGGGGGGGGGVTPEEVQNMINSSMRTLAPVASSGDYDDLIDKPVIDSTASTKSTNAIQNKGITNFVNSSIETATATFRGTYTTTEALNAASGDKNDFAFLKTTDSAGNEIYSRYRRVEIPQVVPEGYTQLMYITSNGTQYIDTGVQAKRDLKSYIKFTRKSGGNNQFFGIHDNGLYYAIWFSDWRWQLWCGIGSNYVDVSSASSGVTEYLFEYPTVTVNDTVFNISAQSDFTSEKTIYLCAVNGESNKSVIDLYECIIYDNDKTTELKHFYPCKNSSNVCGMYETVEGVFYPDANGGNFTAGPQANGYWSFEYSIPGNIFSSTQFAALNSGINTTKVGQIATNTNNIASLSQLVGQANDSLESML